MAVGERLPDFDLEATGGERLQRGTLPPRTLLYFYPKDDTSGCTIEAHEFSERLREFERAGVSVYGVSPDSLRSHEKFAAKCELSVPLISDPQHTLIGALGLWVEKTLYGRRYMGVERSTVLVEKGTVTREWRKVKPAGHAAEVLEAVSAAS